MIGGKLTETEIGDEGPLCEVEVTFSNGSQVDVQFDDNFSVVRSEGFPNQSDAVTRGKTPANPVQRNEGVLRAEGRIQDAESVSRPASQSR